MIGRRGHVEVEGITGDLDHFDVIESVEEVGKYPAKRLGIIAQTTATEAQVASIRQAITEHNPHADIKFVDTVCLPTKEHQRSLERLLARRVDAVVVVGGRESNNTRALVLRCVDHGTPVLHVQSKADLDPSWFRGFATVGLTAGTSTTTETIDEIHRALVWIGRAAVNAPADQTLPSDDSQRPRTTWEGESPHEPSAGVDSESPGASESRKAV